MKIYPLLVVLLLLAGCSGERVEEFAFRKTMEYQLKNKCEEQDPECAAAIEAQIVQCMQDSDWKRFLDSDEDEEELLRFTRAFFPCFKDPRGNPYFGLGQVRLERSPAASPEQAA